jgi:hypothetical protein
VLAIALRALGALGALAALGTPAAAQPSGQAAAATAQFDKGRALLKDKRYAEACAAFEQSQKLDPQWGTLFNLAACYAQSGKLASAWAAYRELAQRDTNAGRRKESARRAKALDKRLPRLAIKAADAPVGLVVTLDGADVTGLVGTDSPIDLGPHKIHASAPNHKDFDAATTITDEARTAVVAIALEPAAEPAHAPARSAPVAIRPSPVAIRQEPAARRDPVGKEPPAPVEAPAAGVAAVDAAPRSRRRTYGVIVAAGGGALVVTGLVFARLASSKWSDAKALCGDDLMCDTNSDLAAGNQLVSDARSQATLSTAFVIGGAAAIGVGAYLFLTAPSGAGATSTALRITPGASPEGLSLTVAGRF